MSEEGKGKGKVQNQPNDEEYDVEDDASIASEEDLDDRGEIAGFRVQLDHQKLDPKSDSPASGIRITAEGGEKVCFDLGDDEDQELSEQAQEELRKLHKATTDLRLQKIYQHDKYHTPSPPANLNQDFFKELHGWLEKENYKFTHLSREELAERKHVTDTDNNKIYKYSEDQANEFDTAGTNLHQALAINKVSENNFTITHIAKSPHFGSHPYASQVNVSFKEESSAKKIAIKGKQDNISVMLLAAMTAKEKLGNNAKYYIYSSKNIEGLAELFARAEIYGLDPKPVKRPEKSEEEFKQFEELVNSSGFQQRINYYKSINQLSELHLPNNDYKRLNANKLAEAKHKASDDSDATGSDSKPPIDGDVATSSTHPPHNAGPTLRRKR